MNFYSKPYVSIGGFECRLWYHFSVCVEFKKECHQKKFGYWNVYYDGFFHFFSIYPIKISWLKRPIPVKK